MSKIIDKAKTASLWIDLIYEMIKNKYNISEDINNNYKICQEISKKVINASGIELKVNGKENIPVDSSVLIASNHRSFFDILVLLATIDRTMSFAAAEELYKYPILKDYIQSIECISIDRYTKDMKKIKQQLIDMSEGLKKGGLILFPEGECNYFEDEISEFKKGGFMSVSACDSYIVPTYINVENVKSLGRWVIPEKQITVNFGQAFKVEEISDKRVRPSEITEYTRNKVLQLKEEYKNSRK